MELLLGDSFRKGEDTVELEEVMNAKEFIAIYFCAHWCPPCRGFTNVLKEVYDRVNEQEKLFEIIFVSYDGSQNAFERNYSEMPWLALSYTDARNKLYKQQFGVTGIPTLVVLNKVGEVVTYDGRGDVQSLREECIDEWKKIIIQGN